MSKELVVWNPEHADHPLAAADLYDAIYEGTAGLPDEPAVACFRRELTALWPELTVETEGCAAPSSPWAAGFDASTAHVVLCVRDPRADEVGAIVRQLAAMHGLVVYDPRQGRLWLPPSVDGDAPRSEPAPSGAVRVGPTASARDTAKPAIASATLEGEAVRIPAAIRRALGLAAGDRVEFRLREDGAVVVEAAARPRALRTASGTRGDTPRRRARARR